MITVESCELDELVIDDGIVSSSFVVRFGLLCDDFYIRGIFSALIMVGMLLGSYPAGYISGQILQLHLVLENYQALLWYIFQASNFLREMATHHAERYTKTSTMARALIGDVL